MVMILMAALCGGVTSCSKKKKSRKVEFEQIEIDGSTNDRYLFREEIRKEKERQKRSEKKRGF